MSSQAQTGGSQAQADRRGHADGRSLVSVVMPEVEAE